MKSFSNHSNDLSSFCFIIQDRQGVAGQSLIIITQRAAENS